MKLATHLVVGPPFSQRLKIPKRYRRAVAWLLAHPSSKTSDYARYLRYNLVVDRSWAIDDAKAIAEDTYPWDQYGFSVDSEGNFEGPDCLVQDHSWNLMDPRGEPTLDLKRVAEVWDAESVFMGDKERPAHQMKVRVVVTARGNANLFETLARIKN